MRSAVLRGREHLVLGEIAAMGEGCAGAAISLGGARKTYRFTDPNEDAALFAYGETGWIVGLADGHRGFEASEVAVDHVLANPAPHWTESNVIDPERWELYALAVFNDANDEILREVARSPKFGTRTTLALAWVVPAQDRLFYAAIGDSHIFRVTDRHAEDLAVRETADDHTYFLGHAPETAEKLQKKCSVGSLPLGDTRAVVLASDGLSEQRIGVVDPEAAVLDAVDRAQLENPGVRPISTARRVVATAMDAQHGNRAGDNICTAVLWVRDCLSFG